MTPGNGQMTFPRIAQTTYRDSHAARFPQQYRLRADILHNMHMKYESVFVLFTAYSLKQE